jgi:hypothetical protein
MSDFAQNVQQKARFLKEMDRIPLYLQAGLVCPSKGAARMQELSKLVTWLPDGAVDAVLRRCGSENADNLSADDFPESEDCK